MRRLRSRLLGALVAALALAALGGSAFAYFSAGGLGSASAAVSNLGTPKITAATPAVGGTVALTWSAASAPDSEAVKYYVSRDGGDPAGTCATPGAPAAAISCTDREVPVGTHEYTVTAVWRSWTTTSTAATAKITTGAVDHFAITAPTEAPAVGASTNLTIVAKDENETTVSNYTGSHSLVFSGASSSPGGTAPTVVNSSGTATAFGKATALTFTGGVASVSSSKNGLLKIYRSGPAEIVAAEGALTTAAPLSLNVVSGAPTKYTLTAPTAAPVAGAANDLTITAVDTYGNAAAAYAGLRELTFSGASASPGGDLPTVSDAAGNEVPFGTATPLEFVAGVAAASGVLNGEMKLYRSGSTSIKASDGVLTNSTALTQTVAAAPASKLVLAASTTAPLSTATTNLTTTAKDPYENNATSYTGAKSLTFSGPSASPSGSVSTIVNNAGTQVAFGSPVALTFSTSGVAAVSSSKNGLIRLYRAGATEISATDGTISTETPLAMTVGAGAASRIALTGVSASAGTVSSACLFTCPVTGLGNKGTIQAGVIVTDASGNQVSELGTGHAVKVTVTAGGTIVGTPLNINPTGPAVAAGSFAYTAPTSGSFTHTITVATSAGTVYTSATATASK